jgi:hypothetical protein
MASAISSVTKKAGEMRRSRAARSRQQRQERWWLWRRE